MNLWNFQTEAYEQVTTVTDANAKNYYPLNKALDNQYEILRDQGEQPIQALTTILQSYHQWY
jgi:hypothetical protein